MGNALFALFLTLICETVFGMLFAAPAAMLLAHESASLNDMIFAALLVFCAVVVWLLFQYGFHVLILRMVRKDYVTLGYVFYGFKKIKQTLTLALALAALVAVVTVAFVVSGRIVMAKLNLPIESTSAALVEKSVSDEILLRTGVLLALYALLLVVVFIRFVFVFYLRFDNPDDSVLTLLKKSMRLMRGRYLRLIRLVLRAGGHNLAIAAGAFALTLFIPATNEDGSRTGLSVAVMLFNFVYFVNAYTALLRMYFAFPVLYTDALLPTVDETIADDKDSVVLTETVALLSGDDKTADAALPADDQNDVPDQKQTCGD